jgi:hypothetical protein
MKYLAMLGVAALAIACDSATSPNTNALAAPATAANAVQFNDKFDATTFAPDNCNGGGITLTATWHELYALTFDGAGGVHVKQHINVQGQGSNPATGVDYVAAETLNDEYNAKVGFEETYTLHYNLIAKGKAPNAMLAEDFHITVNPDGTVTSYHDNFRIVCQ